MLLSFGTAIWTVFSGPSRKNSSQIDVISAALTLLKVVISGCATVLMVCPMPT